MAKKFNIDNVTNLDNERMIVNGEKSVDISSDISAPVVNPGRVDLYKFDIMTGKVSAYGLNCNLAHSVPVRFANELKARWYFLLNSEIDQLHAAFSEVNKKELDEIQAEKYEVAERRFTAWYSAYKPVNGYVNKDIGYTVRDVASMLYGCKYEDYDGDIRKAFSPIVTEVKKLDGQYDEKTDRLPNLKNLRALVGKFCAEFWRSSESCTEFVWVPSASLTADIFRQGYAGRKIDRKTLNVERSHTEEKKLLNEVILACVEDLQKKFKAANKPEQKKAASKASKADATEK